jgi:hypothetical protein
VQHESRWMQILFLLRVHKLQSGGDVLVENVFVAIVAQVSSRANSQIRWSIFFSGDQQILV